MAGQPQLRESALLYAPGDQLAPLAMLRLEERMDGSGMWDLYLNDPASGPRQHAEHPNEASARAELERVYEAGRADGEWRIHRPEPY